MTATIDQRPIIVTGANGFVGRYVLDQLVSDSVKENDLISWYFSNEDTAVHCPNPIRVDITDCESVERQIRDSRPRTVIHLAGISEPAKVTPTGDGWRINVDGVFNLAKAIRLHSPDTRIVFAGSAEVYGEAFNANQGIVSENTALAPKSAYGLTKAVADMILSHMQADGFDVVRLRAFNHTGPGQRPDFVVPDFAHQIAKIERGDSAARNPCW